MLTGVRATRRYLAGMPILLPDLLPKPPVKIPTGSKVIAIKVAIGEARMLHHAVVVDVVKRKSAAHPVDRVLAKAVYVYSTGRSESNAILGLIVTEQQINAIQAVDGPYGIDWVDEDYLQTPIK